MVMSYVTVYVIAFSSVILLGKSTFTTTTTPASVVVTARPNHRRGVKIYFHNHVRTINGSMDVTEALKTDQKLSETHFERAEVLQNPFVPSNLVNVRKLSNDSIRHMNATNSYFFLFDPVNTVTNKLEVSRIDLHSEIRYRDFQNLAEPKVNRIKHLKNKSKEKIKDFIEWDILRDSEEEVRIHYKGITAKETVVKTEVDEESGKRQGLKLRQLTDGTHFIQLIYTFDNEIQDCEYIKGKGVIQKFLKSFREIVENAKRIYQNTANNYGGEFLEKTDAEKDDNYVEDEGKIEKYSADQDLEEDLDSEKEYRNVTFQIIRSEKDLPRELAMWMNYSSLKQKCRENHRMLKQLAFDKKHGDELAKKLAEEHIERKKRDIMDVLLVPGTKWCGKGRTATKYTSLGGFSRTDKCCRVHDTMCPHWIGSLEEKYGLFNWRINTIMHCRCDKRFRACLKMAKTGTANFVGKLFFNVVQTKCFVLKPQEVCLKYSWWGKCEKKEYRKKAYLKDNLSY